jgi:DNA-binding PadR family transcriptional regulator
VSENNRRARYYSLTRAGRERLRQERAEWQRVSQAVSLVMQLRDA